MPSSSTNTTNTSSSGNATHVSSHPATNRTNTSTVNSYDPASNLGYGVGRLLRGAFDLASSAWQNWWNPGSSQEKIAHQRQMMIYHQGLEECVKHLDRAIDNLRKNPHDPQSLKRIEQLASHYASYVQPAPVEALKQVQQKLFQPIEEKIAKFHSDDLKRRLAGMLPISSSKNGVLADVNDVSKELNRHLPAAAPINKRSVMQQSFPAIFNLSALDGSNGFTIPGVVASGWLGFSVSSAGDINGDTLTDLVLGAAQANTGLGVSYVLFGSRSGFPAVFDLTTLNGNNGFTIPGVATTGFLGRSVSSAGDINGDNVTDLVLGANSANSSLGVSYVIFGSRSGFPAVFNLNNLNGSNGFTIPGVAGSGQLGNSVSGAVDINGDTLMDLVLGALNANLGSGVSYVIFGSRSGFPAVFNLTNLNGSNGFTIPGVAGSGQLGNSVSGAVDINGDTLMDLVLGALNANLGSGVSYVLFGSRSGFPAVFNLTTLNGSNGFTIPGVVTGGWLGRSVSSAGDINGDNITDLVLGASSANSGSGASYVIFGSRSGFPAVFNLNNLNGSNGFTIPGVAAGGEFGFSVSSAGDINGDNVTDLVLGADNANSSLGVSYVLFGSRSGFPAVFNLTNLNGSNGFAIPGVVTGGFLGRSVSGAGDINGDTLTDLVLGAYNANSSWGVSYVIFGQNSFSAPTPTPALILTPCSGNQTLILQNNDIQISKGQNLRLTPHDLSASCGNNPSPHLGTAFTITGIEHAQFKTRNSSGFWNNASDFLGSDLSQGNVELLQDNSTMAPEINFTVTDGQTTLPETANIRFNTTNNVPQVVSIVLNIQSNGTTVLNAGQFQITATGNKLDNLVISVDSIQGGYFALVDSSTPITDFTYYQLQNGQIQLVHNGTALPNITLSVGDGSGEPVLFSPLVTFFKTGSPGTSESIPVPLVAGLVSGAAIIVGLTAVGFFQYKKQRYEEALAKLKGGSMLNRNGAPNLSKSMPAGE